LACWITGQGSFSSVLVYYSIITTDFVEVLTADNQTRLSYQTRSLAFFRPQNPCQEIKNSLSNFEKRVAPHLLFTNPAASLFSLLNVPSLKQKTKPLSLTTDRFGTKHLVNFLEQNDR